MTAKGRNEIRRSPAPGAGPKIVGVAISIPADSAVGPQAMRTHQPRRVSWQRPERGRSIALERRHVVARRVTQTPEARAADFGGRQD